MKKLITALLLLSSVAHANVSCDIEISPLNRLQMTEAEEAKIQLYLESKDYNLNPTYSFFEKSYSINFSSIHLSDQKSRNGETLFVVKNIKEPQKASAIEIPLMSDNGPVQILKPKRNFFGVFIDKGTPGYRLAMGLLRDLPKCDKNNPISVNDADRDQIKEVPANWNSVPFSISGGAFQIY